MSNINPEFTNNPSIRGKEDKYLTITVDLDKVVQSWRQSLFSFEWLLPDGSVRKPDELVQKERTKYDLICKKINDNEKIAIPILGIGVMDNIEIGSGREHVLTLYSKNFKTIPVHIPKNNEKEFESFIKK